MKDVLLIPAVYNGSRDLQDKTKILTFQTNEVTPAQAADLQLIVQQFCYLLFAGCLFCRCRIFHNCCLLDILKDS